MPLILNTQTLPQGWENIQDIARQLKAGAQAARAEAVAGNVPGSRFMNYERELRSFRDRLGVLAALPGIAAYVSSLPDTPQGYNVVTEIGTVRAEIDDTINWIRTNFPKDATGHLLERTWGVNGPVERTFSAATLSSAGWLTQLDALIATLG